MCDFRYPNFLLLRTDLMNYFKSGAGRENVGPEHGPEVSQMAAAEEAQFTMCTQQWALNNHL